MTINYPNNQLIIGGKHLLEVASLFAMNYISSNAEPVEIEQFAYKEWSELNGFDYFTHLQELATEGAVIENCRFLLQMSLTDYQTKEAPTGQTWEEWANSTPTGANFTQLKLRLVNGVVTLRPSHYFTLPSSYFLYFANKDYITLID